MVRDLFERFKSLNVLVIGDFMLDKYTYGIIERISPEAPVPILNVTSNMSKIGGAGNVVLNLLALNANVTAIGKIGDDDDGYLIKSLIKKSGAVDLLHVDENCPTIVKNRIIAASQQLVRIDKEKIASFSKALEKKILDNLLEIIKDQDIIALSDYAKGFFTKNLLSKIITLANENNVPVIVDPKGTDFSKYKYCTIIKPNLKEAYSAANMPMEKPLDEVAKKLCEITQAKYVFITRSEKGISFFDFSKDEIQRKDFPCISKEVNDVTGAGDTVLSIASLSFAAKINIETMLMLSNIAAGIVVEHIGCGVVRAEDLINRINEEKLTICK